MPPEGAAESASAHSAGPGFLYPSVCGSVGMVACCVAWSRGPMPNQVACCVVGLWGCGVCVCVCFIGRLGPKKLQKSASFANFYQNRTKMGPKSITNETNLGQGGGRGNRKLTKI